MTIMKNRIPYPLLICSCIIFFLFGCKDKNEKVHKLPTLVVADPPFATGLKSPIGLAEDEKGNVWVTEAGSGAGNDGQVTLITPSGVKYPVITGFISRLSPENSPEGLNHLLYKDGLLHVLHGVEDMLYIIDVSKFVPGTTAPIQAGTLQGDDIGTFVRNAHPNAPDDKDSNPFLVRMATFL